MKKTLMFGPLLLFNILMHLHAAHDNNFCHVNSEDENFCDTAELIYKRRRNEAQRVRERSLIQTSKIYPRIRKSGIEKRDTLYLKGEINNNNGDCFLAHAHMAKQSSLVNQMKIRGSKRKRKKVKRNKKWKRKKNKHKIAYKSCQLNRI